MNKEDNKTLEYFKKVYDELIQDEKYQKYASLMDFYHKKIEDLQHQLEEKDKVIDEILDFTFCSLCPYEILYDEEQEECDKLKKICDCNNCKKTYRECWLKYFENKTLERGKNDND